MRRASVRHLGRVVRYQVTENAEPDDADGPVGSGTPALWAVNVHGFFAGGGMYARESAQLARVLGWRVVNPHLPAFGGSAPLARVSAGAYADAVLSVMDDLEIEHAVLLGHSMGAAFAVALADAHPDRVLGIVCRDGVASGAWRRGRRGLAAGLLRPLTRRGAELADMGVSVLADLPELLMGRDASRVALSLWPDARRNLRHLHRHLPVAQMVLALDLREELARLGSEGEIPCLAVWGLLDRITPATSATEFAAAAGCEVVWVVGGHSWMLAQPEVQASVLGEDPRGRRFTEAVERRHRALTGLAQLA
jgi:pimeloyl-ACP methyl ester carboxylesterase